MMEKKRNPPNVHCGYDYANQEWVKDEKHSKKNDTVTWIVNFGQKDDDDV